MTESAVYTYTQINLNHIQNMFDKVMLVACITNWLIKPSKLTQHSCWSFQTGHQRRWLDPSSGRSGAAGGCGGAAGGCRGTRRRIHPWREDTAKAASRRAEAEPPSWPVTWPITWPATWSITWHITWSLFSPITSGRRAERTSQRPALGLVHIVSSVQSSNIHKAIELMTSLLEYYT